MIDPGDDPTDAPPRARADGHPDGGHPRHAHRRRPHRRRGGTRRGLRAPRSGHPRARSTRCAPARRAAGCASPRTTPRTRVAGGDEITVAGITFEVVDVPGHSAGHVAFHHDGELFAGDLLFAGSVGRSTSKAATGTRCSQSVRALSERFPPETVVHPGHGPCDDARAGSCRRTRSCASCAASRRREREVPGTARDARRPAGRRRVVAPRPHDGGGGVRSTAGAGSRRRASRTPRLFARTSGEASDVVHKEMYTFTDRSDRSLTLRPEGTAPIARAYLEHGLHREPQPVKAYTIAPMYRYGAPGRGRYREHYQLSRRGDRLGGPGDRRRDHPALPRAAAASRRDEVGVASELDRRRELQARSTSRA